MRKYTCKELEYLKDWQASVSKLNKPVREVDVRSKYLCFYFGNEPFQVKKNGGKRRSR